MLPLSEMLQKLEHLRDLLDRYNPIKYTSTDEARGLHRQIPEVYCEVEEVYRRFTGELRVEVKDRAHKHVFPNYFEAGYLSGRTFHATEGYNELLKVIGRVKSEIAISGGASPLRASIDAVWPLLHPKVRAIATERFRAGHYADAVEAALKALNKSNPTT